MKISIITVTYQCVATVGECLDAVASQTYADREHLVIDGASDDGTLAVLEARRGQLAALVSERDQGRYFAMNKGLARARGEVVGFLHGDDVLADPGVLGWVAAAFADPAVMAVYGDLEYVSRTDPSRVVRHWRSRAFAPGLLRRGWMPPHPTLYLRRSVYERLGGFDTRYRIAADYDLILRVLRQLPGRAVYLPRVLVRMRLGGESNRNLGSIARKSWEDFLALRRNGLGGPAGLGAVAWKNLSKVPQFLVRAK